MNRTYDYLTKWSRRARSHPVIAVALLCAAILIATGNVAQSIDNILTSAKTVANTFFGTRERTAPQISLSELTDLKVDTLDLMSKAHEPFSEYEDKVSSLILRLKKTCEIAKGWNREQLTGRVCDLQADDSRHLAGGFFKYWKEHRTLSPIFIKEAQSIIGDAFDSLIVAEGQGGVV